MVPVAKSVETDSTCVKMGEHFASSPDDAPLESDGK